MKYGITLKVYLKKNLIENQCIIIIYINTKIRVYNDLMYTKFQYKEILKDNEHCKCLPIAPKESECYAYFSTGLLDSNLVNSNNEYHPEIYLKKCLYAVNKKVSNTSFKALVLDESDDESNN